MAGAAGEQSLQESPMWAIAVVCAAFIVVSVFIGQCIHFLAKWFQKSQKKAMMEALEKIKAELMLLGFMSLVLTVSIGVLSKICIPASYGKIMLPCKFDYENKDDGDHPYKQDDNHDGDHDHDKRKLLSLATDMMQRRSLAASAPDDYCSKHGKISLISQSGLHQLHIFIFVLAVFHVLYSVVTMALARAKMKKWKAWEAESLSLEYQYTHDPERFRFTHQTSFVRRHSGYSRVPGIIWIVAFHRQFFGSVSKVDYLTMRHGFINAHLAPNSKFDFHKYIKRSMEDDFKAVVGISFPLWISAILFLLLNEYKLYALTWLSLAPLLIILSVGTKLQVIIMEMAQGIQDRTSVVKGAPVVEPNDKFFWFNRPQWVLLLIHFALFQNAFQMSFFLWTWREFGWRSCFHENVGASLCRVLLGLALLFLCSYITFPLYALVTQMGSHMKKAIFEEQMAKALKNWHKEAKVRNRQLKKAGLGGDSSSPSSPSSSPPSTTGHATSSPLPLLDKHQAGNGESLPISPMTDHPSSSPPNKDRLSSPRTQMDEPHETHPPSKRQCGVAQH
ncbi:MLO protein homolog 1-like [Syzygium oleosum]|uniref:MLO protein homolog 1-like n=1 Tax=Syzygium oleosum TaxID=219896 RepID=UPI0024B9A625|nr:MLO protein homolog 1-like [Syzygium oleosum]